MDKVQFSRQLRDFFGGKRQYPKLPRSFHKKKNTMMFAVSERFLVGAWDLTRCIWELAYGLMSLTDFEFFLTGQIRERSMRPDE